MGSAIDNVRQFFGQKSILVRLILINIIVFLILRFAAVIATLFNIEGWSLLQYLELPAYLPQILWRSWTLVSYMFTHFDVLHILFNMLWLYWFGQIFLMFFNEKQLTAVYLLGGLLGALFFVLSYNLFPYFNDKIENSYLIGASASVMAIVFAASFFKKDFRVNLLLVGSVKIYYIAIVILLIDMLAVTSSNAGGHLAHLGGAAFGICYALSYQKGKDLTAALNKTIDKLVNLFKKNRGMRVTYQKREKDYQYNDRRNKDTREIDQILDKIKKSGYNSLSQEEKKRLFDASNK